MGKTHERSTTIKGSRTLHLNILCQFYSESDRASEQAQGRR